VWTVAGNGNTPALPTLPDLGLGLGLARNHDEHIAARHAAFLERARLNADAPPPPSGIA
jgi:hypothetical protein